MSEHRGTSRDGFSRILPQRPALTSGRLSPKTGTLMNRRLIATLSFGHLMTDLNQGMLPALLPFFIAERGLTFAAAGGLVLAANVAASATQPLFGWFADRRPSPWLIPAGIATAGVGLALAGVAPTYPPHRRGGRVRWGSGSRPSTPRRCAGPATRPARSAGHRDELLLDRREPRHRDRAARHHAARPRVGAPGLAGPPSPDPPRGRPAGRRDAPHRPPAATRRRPRRRPGLDSAVSPDRWGLFGRLSVTIMTRSMVYAALSTFIPLFWIGVLGRTKAEGAVALSIVMGAGVAGTLLGGRLADRYGRRVVVLVAMGLLPPLLLALGHGAGRPPLRRPPRPGGRGPLRPVQRRRRHGAGVPAEPDRHGLGDDPRPRRDRRGSRGAAPRSARRPARPRRPAPRRAAPSRSSAWRPRGRCPRTGPPVTARAAAGGRRSARAGREGPGAEGRSPPTSSGTSRSA